MALSFSGTNVVIDGVSIQTQWPVLQVSESHKGIYVLLDPDSYLTDSSYKSSRRAGAPAIRNLLAFNRSGQKLWEGELPEETDYYYALSSVEPLVVNSFSSYRCELDGTTGAILQKEFLK